MRLDTVPENLLERIALRAGVVPTPLGDTIVAMTLARAIMVARKWLLKSSPQSLYDYMLFNFLNWTWDERFEDFLRTGKPTHIHQEMSKDEWRVYQRAMRSLAGFSAFEVARRIPMPRGALRMLDLGGSHGYYSVMLCRRYPELRSVVFDLPEAVEHAATILA